MGLLERLFGSKNDSVNLKELVNGGAEIIDVRTPGEYAGGHINNAVNIPLDTLKSKLVNLRKDQSIIVYCASGVRSSAAKKMLELNGFTHVYNGGGINKLESILK
ncbi:MAG: rhodanese-like domain-containing protein [Bacteroidales bacterium]